MTLTRTMRLKNHSLLLRLGTIPILVSFLFFLIANLAIAANANAATEKRVRPRVSGLTLSESAAELIQLLNNMNSMQATFEQSQLNEKGSQIGEKTIGTMMLERQGKFRWQITKPIEQLIVVNKNRSYLYDSDLEQVTVRKIDYNHPGNPAMLLSSPTDKLISSFALTKIKSNNKDSQFQLKPKTQNPQETGYQWIKIGFVKGKLNSMQTADNLGQKSEIKFNNVTFNPKIPSKMFVFTPPPGTDVFEAN